MHWMHQGTRRSSVEEGERVVPGCTSPTRRCVSLVRPPPSIPSHMEPHTDAQRAQGFCNDQTLTCSPHLAAPPRITKSASGSSPQRASGGCLSSEILCPLSRRMIPEPGWDYACFDPTTAVSNCGGCMILTSTAQSAREPQGRDCRNGEGVKEGLCQAGTCEVGTSFPPSRPSMRSY